MIRKIQLILISLAVVVFAASCAGPDYTAEPGEGAGPLRAWIVPLPDGREVVCVAGRWTENPSGVDCDWEGAE